MEEYGYAPLQFGNDGAKMGDTLSKGEERGGTSESGADQGSRWSGTLAAGLEVTSEHWRRWVTKNQPLSEGAGISEAAF